MYMVGFKIAAAALLVSAPVAGAILSTTQTAPAASPVSASVADDPALTDAAKKLATSICAQVAALPADADPTRIEADIVFALSQSGADIKTQVPALQYAGQLCLTGGAGKTALASALDGVRKGAGTGTGAVLAQAGRGGFTSGVGFSSPSINVGGGSVNYSN